MPWGGLACLGACFWLLLGLALGLSFGSEGFGLGGLALHRVGLRLPALGLALAWRWLAWGGVWGGVVVCVVWVCVCCLAQSLRAFASGRPSGFVRGWPLRSRLWALLGALALVAVSSPLPTVGARPRHTRAKTPEKSPEPASVRVQPSLSPQSVQPLRPRL